MARKRAQQRWSAQLTRIAQYVREPLGEQLWRAFVAHAEVRYKDAYVAAFRAPALHCAGTARGAPCPHAFKVDLCAPSAFVTLELLHLDHEQDLDVTCVMWAEALAALPHRPASWDEGVDGGLLCHLLFGVRTDPVHGAPMLRFRCRKRTARATPCHKLNTPHYRGLREVREGL